MPTIRGISSASTSPLGSGIDGPIARRQMAFAPAELDGMLDGATVGGRRLVKNSFVVVDTPADAVPDGPTPLVSVAAVCVLAFPCRRSRSDRLRKNAPPPDERIPDAMWFTVLGLTGCPLTFLIFVSVHEATSPNLSLYGSTPSVCLCLRYRGCAQRKKILRIYFAACGAALVSCSGCGGGYRSRRTPHSSPSSLLRSYVAVRGYSPHCQKKII